MSGSERRSQFAVDALHSSSMLTHRSLFIVLFWVLSAFVQAKEGRNCAPRGNVKVECSAASAFITLDIQHCRRLGRVVIEVRDATGRILYREEGKALTGSLVRRLDKGAFPTGDHTLSITTRDLALKQIISVR
jgi:hypothetical protein